MEEKYTFVKDWQYNGNTITKGNVIYIAHGCVYYNGGLVPPSLQGVFMNLIVLEKRKGYNYLKPEKLIYNKC